MSTPKERADARHELPRQRERELVEVVKAAQDAADATTDAELTAALGPRPRTRLGRPRPSDARRQRTRS